MCEMCETQTISYGQPFGEIGNTAWHLVRATKDGDYMSALQWGLVLQNTPTFIWTPTPIYQPELEGMVDWHKMFSLVSLDYTAFSREFRECGAPLDEIAYLLRCMEAKGFKVETARRVEEYGNPGLAPTAEFWLWNYLGKWLMSFQVGQEHLPSDWPADQSIPLLW